jgi:hypothetical protein
MTADVAFRTPMLTRYEQFLEHLIPILHRLVIHFDNDMPDDRRANPFVREAKMNVGRVAAVEFEDWLYRRAHLLALPVGGIAGNTHSHASNEGRDDRFVSGCRARLLLLRHGADHIAVGVGVNQSGS